MMHYQLVWDPTIMKHIEISYPLGVKINLEDYYPKHLKYKVKEEREEMERLAKMPFPPEK